MTLRLEVPANKIIPVFLILLIISSSCSVLESIVDNGGVEITITDFPTAVDSTESGHPPTQQGNTKTSRPQQTPQMTQVISTQSVDSPTATESPITVEVPRDIDSEGDDEYIYVVQPGSPIPMVNWSHPEDGCNWLGVAGQVFDFSSSPVMNLVVESGGSLEGEAVLGLSITGLAPIYGDGGYEITLADHPVGSDHTVWLQLFDLFGNTLSDKSYIQTFDEDPSVCVQNLILLNFVQWKNLTEEQIFFPVIP